MKVVMSNNLQLYCTFFHFVLLLLFWLNWSITNLQHRYLKRN